jgi:uncharacterized protein (TIGR03118 family)
VYLRKLSICNFRKLKSVQITFEPGLNILVGPNNVGKTTVIDALRGAFVKTLIQGPHLNQPWGIALAPSNFGPLSNTLLVSNNSNDGTINGFDPTTGKFVGTIRDEFGRKISLTNLWGIAFGGGTTNNGATNQLFVTAGPGKGAQAQLAGTFASIVFNPTPYPGHDQDDDGHTK